MKKNLFITLALLVLLLMLNSCTGIIPDTLFLNSQESNNLSTDTVNGSSEQSNNVSSDTALLQKDVNSEYTTSDTTAVNEWNPHIIYGELTENENYVTAANAFIDAVINYDSSVTFADADSMNAVNDNIFYGFPLSAIVSYTPDPETLTMSLSYKYEKSQHLSAVDAFGRRVTSIIEDTVESNDSDVIKALLLYRWVAVNVNYFSADYEDWQTNSYNALINGNTICYGFADAYNYLLAQVNIKAYLLKGESSINSDAHAWSLVKLDGEYYHCDPTWESSSTGGKGLLYFGLNELNRFITLSTDCHHGEGICKQQYSLNTSKNSRFTLWRSVRSDWTLDRDKNSIMCGSEKYSID